MSPGSTGGESPGAIKQQIIGLIHAVAYLRGDCLLLDAHTGSAPSHVLLAAEVERFWCCAVPLIVVNTLVILVKLIFG